MDIYTPSNMLRGEIRCPANLRILDIFNGANSNKACFKGDFLEFLNVYEPGKDSAATESHRSYIRRDSIQFLAISEANKGRGIGAQDDYKSFPFVRKTPTPVSLKLTAFNITGSLHLSQGQTSQELLNSEKQFIPLTQATIDNERQELGTWPFVMVNKYYVTWLWEKQPATPESDKAR